MSIGNGNGKISGMVGDAVSKIGLPGVFALILLYGIWKIGSDLTDSHIVFLKAAAQRMEVHRVEDERITAQLVEIVKGQREMIGKQTDMVRNQEVVLKFLSEMKR